ncbi:hypothetical protein [Undibacterium sp. Ren11W]|uniref:hypothetical protein n=1 Tax=Undibacterium sp. Ren11W TaxID=3413045 RepID=UPI003BF38892
MKITVSDLQAALLEKIEPHLINKGGDFGQNLKIHKQASLSQRPVLLAMGASLLLAVSGCGGGSGGDSSPVSAAPAVSTFTTTGSVVDGNSVGVADANIVTTIGAQNYGTSTKADGSFELTLPKNAPFPKFFEATVIKDGNVTGVILFTSDNGQVSVISPTKIVTPVKSIADLSFPNLTNLFHLGDGTFTGVANSQLQIALTGASIENQFTLSAEQLAQYASLNISFYGRGIQTGTVQNCKDYAILLKLDDNGLPNPLVSALSISLPASPDDGSFLKSTINFSLAGYGAGKFSLKFVAGVCEGASTDLDDLEMVAISGVLLH